jgi:D-3-phosphoglycerate dehydrogenase
MKVVIFGDFSEETRHRILAIFPDAWDIIVGREGDWPLAVKDADVIIPENRAVDARLLAGAEKLKLVQTGAGYDNVDIKACTRKRVWVANGSGVNARAVAEHVLGLMLCRAKNLLFLDRAMRAGDYDVAYSGGELCEKTMGIVGLGNIGRAVACLAHALQMKILAFHYHPVEAPDFIEMTDLDTLLRQSDFVSLHVALNTDTRHLISARELAIMKKDAFLINTARGAVVDESALVDALADSTIGGAGLDVFETEPLPVTSPLRRLDNVILTPHMAGAPDGFKFHRRRFVFFRENIQRIAKGQAPINALNQIP